MSVRRLFLLLLIWGVALVGVLAVADRAEAATPGHGPMVTVYPASSAPIQRVHESRITRVRTCGIDDDPFDCDVTVRGLGKSGADLRSLVRAGVTFRRAVGWHQVYAARTYVYVGSHLRYSNSGLWKPLRLARDGSGDLLVHHGRTRGRVVVRFYLAALNGHAE